MQKETKKAHPCDTSRNPQSFQEITENIPASCFLTCVYL